MELATYIACICEGAAEAAIIDVLVDNNFLIFTREAAEVLRHLKNASYVKDLKNKFQSYGFLIPEEKSSGLVRRMSKKLMSSMLLLLRR